MQVEGGGHGRVIAKYADDDPQCILEQPGSVADSKRMRQQDICTVHQPLARYAAFKSSQAKTILT